MKYYALIAYFVNYGLNIVFNIKKLKTGSFITKLLLTPILLLIYLTASEDLKIPVILALCFCFLGDLFLEFPKYFIPGLSAFLVGHIFYAVKFLSDITVISKLPWWMFLFTIVYIAYGITLNSRLSIPDLKKKTAVYIYTVIILIASFLSLLRFNSVSVYSFWIVLIGTLLFILSDSILAYNLFKKRSSYGSVWLMAAYGAAQLLIVLGILIG